MAERPKRILRQPKRFVDEYCIPFSKRRKKPVKDNKLYEIELKEVDRERNLVRIHYKGYSDKFDRWQPYGSKDEYFPFIRKEKMLELSDDSLDERAEYFTQKLYREIKRKLYSSKRDDPVVRVEVDAAEDVFTKVLGSLVDGFMERDRLVYNLELNRLLDGVLG